MIEKLKIQYQQLKACDMQLIVDAESHRFNDFDKLLKKRQEVIQIVNDLIVLLSKENLDPRDLDDLVREHEMSMQRDRNVIAVIKSLRDKSKKDFLQCAPQMTVGSPYMKKPPQQRVKI